MRVQLLLTLVLVALAPTARADTLCTFGLACVSAGEDGYLVVVDGEAGNPDPADGYASLGLNGACYDEDGYPGASTSPTCVDSTPCFSYNPTALTNACIEQGGRGVTTPSIATPGIRQCVIGNVCATLPPMTVVPSQTVVTYTGYLEATVACGAIGVCRVDLP